MAGFAANALAQDDYRLAAGLTAAVETQLASLGIRLVYVNRIEQERNLARWRAGLDQKTFAKFRSLGKATTMAQAIAHALGNQGE